MGNVTFTDDGMKIVMADGNSAQFAAIAEDAADRAVTAADRAESARDIAQAAVGVDYANATAALAGAANGDKFTYWDGDQIIFATKTAGSLVTLAGPWIAGDKVSFSQSGTGATARTIQAKAREIISPQDFGAVADGITDDTAALNDWADRIGDNCHGLIQGNYLISARIELIGKKNFSISGAAKIKIANGTATGEANSAFLIQTCEDFIIDGIAVDGNRSGRTAVEASGHLWRVIGGKRGLFRNCRADNGTTDGFYLRAVTPATLTTYPEDMVFENCYGDNCFRNDMSIISAVRPIVRGGRFTNANGTAPQAGIALEPNSSDVHGIIDALIEWPDCSGNTGYGSYAGGTAINNISGKIFVRGSSNGIGLFESGRVKDLEVFADAGPHSGNLTTSQAILYVGTAGENITASLRARGLALTGSGYAMRVRSGPTNVKIPYVDISTTGTVTAGFSSSNADAEIGTVSVKDVTGRGIDIAGPRTKAGILRAYRTTGVGLYIDAADVTISDAYLENSASTTAQMQSTSAATGLVITAKAHQTTSIPGGSNAFRFDAAPKFISLEATGGYTTSNLLTIAAGSLASTKCGPMSPDIWTASASLTPGAGTVAAGATVTISTNSVSRVSVGDRIVAAKPAALEAGLVPVGSPYSDANGTIKQDIINVTAGSISTIARSWSFQVVK